DAIHLRDHVHHPVERVVEPLLRWHGFLFPVVGRSLSWFRLLWGLYGWLVVLCSIGAGFARCSFMPKGLEQAEQHEYEDHCEGQTGDHRRRLEGIQCVLPTQHKQDECHHPLTERPEGALESERPGVTTVGERVHHQRTG